MWSKCKQLCRLQAEVLCRLSSSFCSIPFHSIPFRFISFRTRGIPWHCNSYCNAKMCVATSEIERQLAKAPSSSSTVSMCGRGPHCSLAVAFYCLLLGVNWETASLTDTFGVPASCQDRSKNYACHRKLFELEANDGRRQQTPPLSRASSLRNTTQKRRQGIHMI